MSKIYDVLIIGAGPAGMMAAISAKTKNNSVCILEKNSSAGIKLLLSGKGRCNVTTTKDIGEIVDAFGSGGKFLYGSLSRFSNVDVIKFFEDRGAVLKTERGQRVFPVSDKAETILNALMNELKRKNVEVLYDIPVKSIVQNQEYFDIRSRDYSFRAISVIVTTGGASYPQTGSSGDGYKLAKNFGHNVISPIPALTPLISNDKNITKLSGLSLKNVEITFSANDKVFASGFGEMLFTHKGISGPIVLKCSRSVYEHIALGEKVQARIDLKPKIDEKTLRARIINETFDNPKKEYQSLLAKLLPKSLILYAASWTQIDPHKQSSTLTKEQIDSLVHFLKSFDFEIEGVESIKRAIVTHGGVNINEINPKTMESKLINNLYFAGEVICLDGPTGGYNLTKAFSTGFVAGLFAKNK